MCGMVEENDVRSDGDGDDDGREREGEGNSIETVLKV